MEWVGIVAGFGLAGVVGYLLGRDRTDARAGRARKEPAGDEDLQRLRLELQDYLDKMHHLYDRIRKRLPEGAQASQLSPQDGARPFRTGAEVLLEAKRRGMTIR